MFAIVFRRTVSITKRKAIMKTTQALLNGLASLLVISFGSLSLAQTPSGIFLEPGVTYELGDHTVNWPSPLSDSTGTTRGLGLALRGGFHLNESFFLGLDARYGMPTFKNSASNYDAAAKAYNYGPVVGFQMPDMGLRLWGAYVLDGELNPEASGNYDVNLKKPTGPRVGLGFRVQSFSLNVEYEQLKYGESVLEQAGPFTPGYVFNGVNLENKAWILSASFPIEF